MVDKKPQKSNAFWQNIVRKWGEYNRWIIFLLFIMAVFIVVISLYFYLTANENYLYPSNFWERLSDPEEPLNVRNILLGLAGIVGLFLAGWRGVSMDRQTKTDERRQITESKQFKADQEKQLEEKFDNAVQSLSRELNENSYSDHTNAITTLRYIALNNTSYTQRCLDIICRCNQWMEGFLTEFSVYKKEHCYADEFLTEVNRIAKTNDELKETVSLHQERRSQAAIKAVALILDRIGADDPKKHLLVELDFSDKMLCGINLSGSEIEGVNFNRAYLNGSDLSDARLKKATFRGSSLQGADLHRANMQGAQLRRANMRGANLESANMQGAKLEDANMQEAKLFGVDLQTTHLNYVDLQRASLVCANLQNTRFFDVKIQEVDLFKANMQLAHLNSVHLQGANLNNTNLQGAKLRKVNLQGADLENANMRGAHIEDTNMQGTKLTRANMQGAIILGANLYGAEINDNLIEHVMFDEISKVGHITEELERKEFIDSVCGEMHDEKRAKSFIERMNNAWDKADKGEEPKGLDRLRDASILNKIAEGKWEVDGSKIEGLKGFYRKLMNHLSTELNHSKLDIISLISSKKFNNELKKDYPKVVFEINKAWSELKEGIEKEEGKQRELQKLEDILGR